jgi:hypothetical protein
MWCPNLGAVAQVLRERSRLDEETYLRRIQLRLAGVTNSAVASGLGISKPYAAKHLFSPHKDGGGAQCPTPLFKIGQLSRHHFDLGAENDVGALRPIFGIRSEAVHSLCRLDLVQECLV